MPLTCGFTGRTPAAYNKTADQAMINCVRGELEPLAYITGADTDLWLSV